MQEKNLLQALPHTVHCIELSPGKGASHTFHSPRRFPMYQTSDAVTDCSQNRPRATASRHSTGFYFYSIKKLQCNSGQGCLFMF